MATTIVKPRSRKEIREIALFIREIYSSERVTSFPILKFMEYVIPEFIEGFQYIIKDDSEMGDCDGKTFPEKRLIYLKRSVYDGAYYKNPRDRFTVAHEVGHLLLHDNESISYGRTNKPIKPYENPEWQANTFAAELLIPINQIRNLSPYEISEMFNVSLSAAKIQLKYAINS